MKKIANSIKVLIVLTLLTYISLGSTSIVLAAEIEKEENQMEENASETSIDTEQSDNTSDLKESENLNPEEETVESKVEGSEEIDKEITLEEQNSQANPDNQVSVESETEASEEVIERENDSNEKKAEIHTAEEQESQLDSNSQVPTESETENNAKEEQNTSEETVKAESLLDAVSKDIEEEGYVYSSQKNRELAIQMMEEDLAEKNKPRLFARMAYVPSHVTAFIEKFAPLAVKYANQKGLYPSVMLAQAALESGWGGSSLSQPPYHQLFGIKDGNFSGKVITVPTEEWVKDKSHPDGGYMITIYDDFRVYGSFDEAFKDQSNFLMGSRYTSVRRANAPTYQHATQALSSAGYATDPHYASKLNNIIQSYNLSQYDNIPTVAYSTHIQSKGWLNEVTDGEGSGTTKQNKRMEAIQLSIKNPSNLGIKYTTHVQSYGWTDWKADGEVSGTTGEDKRLEAIKIQLTGAQASNFDVYYRVHAQSQGWLGWAKNGESAGTEGLSKRLEAIEVVIIKKGAPAPYGTGKAPFIEKIPDVNYTTHVQKDGWQKPVSNGTGSGTTRQGKRLEAIKIDLSGLLHTGGVQYRTHVQSSGWQNWVENGALSGTTGKAKRLEAIQIQLTEELANLYDIYYRVHAETYGWLGWAKNGESSGTEGLHKRLEAIEIKVVKKGSSAPGSTSNTFIK